MKRHHALEPFSRDHYSGLVAARHLKDNPGLDTSAELLQLWKDEMDDHFREEESLLVPIAPSNLASRLKKEHREIRSMIGRAKTHGLTEDEATKLGTMLHDHIRWEERELFPALETTHQLDEIEPQSQAMELRRQSDGHHPRRAELVSRRKKDS